MYTKRVFVSDQAKGDFSYIKIAYDILIIISTALIIYLIMYSPSVPIINILNSESDSLARQRVESKMLFQGNSYIKNVFISNIVPFTGLLGLSLYNLKLITNKLKVAYSVCLSILVLLFGLDKAPLIYFMIGVYITTGSYLSTKAKLIIPIASIIWIFVSYTLIMNVNPAKMLDLSDVTSPLYRLVYGSYEMYILSFSLFPNTFDFEGLTFFNSIVGSEPFVPPARLMMEHINPYGVSSGVAGLANSYFPSEAWAFGGGLTVFMISLIGGATWGIVFAYITSKTQSHAKPLYISAYAFMSIQLAIITQSSASRLVYNPEITLSALLVITVIAFSKMLNTNRVFLKPIRRSIK
ncbi:hypothetical protein GCM10008959_20240 [Deinococcus seoulensis]|uniref:Oligosaccharide repeat unit polymerase n=1 Tax=Deinococcus seoulensis TaxID=1837379 RepID=A0ABQ2RTL9_9DEIO|nr:hypothetical protein [Deinococcus seoulensis]GGR58515.1 hypothetical protein GCM10008959_20240 [Deinococcus seoulensis]